MKNFALYLICTFTLSLFPIIGQSQTTTGIDKDLRDAIINFGSSTEVRKILESGVDVNAFDEYKRTPLYIASFFHKVQIVKVLLEFGANVDSKDIYNITPLNIGSHGDNSIKILAKTRDIKRINTVKELLNNKADINSKSESGITPLIRAAANGHYKVVELLLENGADINIKTNDGETALSFAKKNNHSEVIKLLEKNKLK